MGGEGAGLVGEAICIDIAGPEARPPKSRPRPLEMLGPARYVVLRGVIL